MPFVPNKMWLLFTFLLCFLPFIGCSPKDQKQPPKAVRGALDLRTWDIQKDGPAQLNGEWEFYYRLPSGPQNGASNPVHKDSQFVSITESRRAVFTEKRTASGLAGIACQLNIKVPSGAPRFALDIRQTKTAYRLLIDGREVPSPEISIAQWKPSLAFFRQVVPIDVLGSEVTLAVQIAEPQGFGRSNMPEVAIGDQTQLEHAAYINIGLRILIIGMIATLGIYLFLLFMSRGFEYSYLFLFCTCIFSIAILSTYEIDIVSVFLSSFPYSAFYRMSMMADPLLHASLFLYARQLYPREFPKLLVGIGIVESLALAAGLGCSLQFAISPMYGLIHPCSDTVILLGGAAGSIYVIVRKRKAAVPMLVGIACLAITNTFDHVSLLQNGFTAGLLPVGLLAFFISQAFVLAQRFAGLQRDNSDKREQLFHAEKLAVIGTLVSGVAHEINNPNASIKLNADLLQKSWVRLGPILDEYAREHGEFDVGDMPYDEFKQAVAEALTSINRNADRIRKLVDDLRTFARKDEDHYNENVDVNSVVRDAISILGAMLRKATTHLEVSYFPETLYIKGNALRLEQVIVNMLNNARQALAGDYKGIFVSTAVDLTRHLAIVTIRDEGCGMDKKTLERIWEPFFTTKGPEEGTGLGLSICNQIVKKHNGELKIKSEPGIGTDVCIFLPLTGDKNGRTGN
jgi:signal transduction histidine kinase